MPVASFQLVNQDTAASILAVSTRTLEGWRVRGGGPKFVRVGRAIRYRIVDLEAFVAEGTRRNTSENPN